MNGWPHERQTTCFTARSLAIMSITPRASTRTGRAWSSPGSRGRCPSQARVASRYFAASIPAHQPSRQSSMTGKGRPIGQPVGAVGVAPQAPRASHCSHPAPEKVLQRRRADAGLPRGALGPAGAAHAVGGALLYSLPESDRIGLASVGTVIGAGAASQSSSARCARARPRPGMLGQVVIERRLAEVVALGDPRRHPSELILHQARIFGAAVRRSAAGVRPVQRR